MRRHLMAGLWMVMASGLAWNCDDPEWECYDACEDLAECESQWLVADGKAPMNDSEFDLYVDKCELDCKEAGSPEEDIECLIYASCDELKDGECRN